MLRLWLAAVCLLLFTTLIQQSKFEILLIIPIPDSLLLALPTCETKQKVLLKNAQAWNELFASKPAAWLNFKHSDTQ